MTDLIEATAAVDLPDLNAAIPCDEVIDALNTTYTVPLWSGESCTFAATLRVTWAHPPTPKGPWHESWTVCRPCFTAMGQAFGGHAIEVHEL